LTLDDIAIKPFIQSDTGKTSQLGFVDSFYLDKILAEQKRVDAVEFIDWMTSKKR